MIYSKNKNSWSVAPHAPYTVNDEHLNVCKKVAEELDLKIHTHLHETAAEVKDSETGLFLPPFPSCLPGQFFPQLLIAGRRGWGRGYAQFFFTPCSWERQKKKAKKKKKNLPKKKKKGNKKSMSCHQSLRKCCPFTNFDDMGLITNRLIAAHMTQLTDAQIQILVERGPSVVHWLHKKKKTKQNEIFFFFCCFRFFPKSSRPLASKMFLLWFFFSCVWFFAVLVFFFFFGSFNKKNFQCNIEPEAVCRSVPSSQIAECWSQCCLGHGFNLQ